MAQPRRSNPRSLNAMPEIARIGRRMAQRRIDLGLTQQTVADLAGVSRSSIQSLEYGTGTVKLASVVEVADVLGLRLEPITVAEAQDRR